jgi:SagB-type dehydrogenase family enzyme
MPSPGLYAVRDRDGWLVHEARTGACLPLSPLLDACLAAFDGGATSTEALRRLGGWPGHAVSTLIGLLSDIGVLVPVHPRGGDGWRAWDGVAERFHFGTRNMPVAPRRTPRPAPPPAVVRRRALARVPLPLPRLEGGLREALVERRSWRQLADAPVSCEDLGTLLGVTFGIQAWADAAGAGPSALKTSPSGGARHSLEAYVCVRRVRGVPSGLYHYRPDEHRLDLLRPGCTARHLAHFLPGQDGYRRASVVCVMASVLERVTWRYSHARAWRVVLTEAGHLAQTFALTATALGLASFSTGALADTAIEDAFALSPATCPVVYAVGAAPRPAGVTWAPFAHAEPPVRRMTVVGRHLARRQR